MTTATIRFRSQILWQDVTYTALVPDGKLANSGPYPVLFQLHGGGQRHTAWLHFSNLADYVREAPLIVVLPDGPHSRWVNGGPPFMAYEDFLMEELTAHVRQTLPATTGRWAIGGNSMGGFGAVRLGLKYPDRFCSIWSHSAVFPRADNIPPHWYWSGNTLDLDCYALVEQLDPRTMPQLSFDCGTDDHLLDHNRRFHTFLEQRDIPHRYQEHAGGHTWEYWNIHIRSALAQHVEELQRLRSEFLPARSTTRSLMASHYT